MEFQSRYTSKPVDAKGYAKYTEEENEVWAKLYKRQEGNVIGRACDEFIKVYRYYI